MFEIIRQLFIKGDSEEKLKRDKYGRPVGNRRGVDTKPNEPFGSKAPPIRYEDEEDYRNAGIEDKRKD